MSPIVKFYAYKKLSILKKDLHEISNKFHKTLARGSLFTDIELCEATATGELGVRSLAIWPIVNTKYRKKWSMCLVV